MKFEAICALKLCIKSHRVGYLCTRKKQYFLKMTAKVPNKLVPADWHERCMALGK